MKLTDKPLRSLRTRCLTGAALAAAGIAGIAAATAIPGSAALATGHSARQPAGATNSGTLPRYFADLAPARACHGFCLIVHNARTGATLATSKPTPGAGYGSIAAGASDTSFVVLAVNRQATPAHQLSFLLARFNPARRTITLRTLPVGQLPNAMTGFALSPDGSQLAVSTWNNNHGELRVYSLATSAVKIWTTTGQVDPDSGQQGLSWGPGGILAFDWSRPLHNPAQASQQGIRLLNTSAPAGDLLAASRLAVHQTQPAGYTLQGRFALIDNGTAAVSVVQRQHPPTISRYDVFSTRTGRVIRSFLPSVAREESVWWANSAGTVIAGDLPGTGASSGLAVLEWITAAGHKHTPVRGLWGGPLLIAF